MTILSSDGSEAVDREVWGESGATSFGEGLAQLVPRTQNDRTVIRVRRIIEFEFIRTGPGIGSAKKMAHEKGAEIPVSIEI